MGLAMVAEALLFGVVDGEEEVLAGAVAVGAPLAGVDGEAAVVADAPEPVDVAAGGAPLYRVAPLGMGPT
jgi:hypothetical protein